MSGTISTRVAGEIFTQAVGRTPLDAIVVLLRAQWNIECVALERLSGERDQNYRLVDRNGAVYVCKVTHPSEPPNVTECQTRVLRHLAHMAPNLPVQRIVPTQHGRDCFISGSNGDAPTTVRLLTYLHGTPMHMAKSSVQTRRSLGASHAQLLTALATLEDIDTAPDLLWDLTHIERIEPLLESLKIEADGRLARGFLDMFKRHALPRMKDLHQQLIHNDLNPYNLLVDGRTSCICGILDFGDLVCAPLLNDVAIAASYLISDNVNPLDGVCDYLGAFHEIFPLAPEEVDVLFALMAGRLIMTVAITEWRSSLHPENRKYILRNNPAAWAGLRRISSISLDEACTRFRRSCAMPA